MAKYLVIVESPAKVKTIQRFLGSNYKIESSVGHVRDLPKSTLGVDIDKNFEPKYLTIRGKAELINKLKKEAQQTGTVYLATDPDREGEAISWHLASILGIPAGNKCRITFNEITANAVKNALKSPRPINMDLVNSQQARRIMDRIVGYDISPLLWKKVRKGLSAGRVQSVALRIICDRAAEIDNFKEEEYWTITAGLHTDNAKKAFSAKYSGDLKNKEEADKVLKSLKGKDFIVGKVKKGEKRKSPAPPFITSTLQQEAARKLGFPIKKTMMLAQQLYEGVEVAGEGSVGLITYMRTDSVRVSAEAQQQARELVEKKYGKENLSPEVRVFKNKNASQDAHEAIRPAHLDFLPESIKSSLTNDQFKLYKLIWERLIAGQMANALYDTVSVEINAGEHLFKAAGSTIKFKGFMLLYTASKEDDQASDDENPDIPELNEGQKLNVTKIEPEQHFTQPPQPYTEATLVKMLEEKGIGRPSTYASIISVIQAREYIVKEKRYLIPTDTGKIVNDIMLKGFKDIVDIGFTAGMEEKLDSVEEGKKPWVEVLQEFYKPFAEDLKSAEETIQRVDIKDEETDIPCEKCGRMMVIKHGRFGKFYACPGYPECKNAKSIVEDLGVKCPKCGGAITAKRSKSKRLFYGCSNYPDCKFTLWDKPVADKKCPKCGTFMTEKFGGKSYKCANENCGYTEKEKEN